MLKCSPHLAQRIAHRREKLGLSQEELAIRVGVKKKYISTLEAGEQRPGPLMLARIAAALEVPLDELNRKERYLWRV